MAKKKRRYHPVPPAPPNDSSYVLVKTKEGKYWRRKRGTVKKAELNETFKRNAVATDLASPAAKRIREKLGEFLKGLNTGRFIANVSAKLKQSYTKTGVMNFSLLNDYDLQPDYPMTALFRGSYFIIEKNEELTIRIPVDKHAVKRHNSLVTDYYFEAVLLSGDPSRKNGLRVESDSSPLYPANDSFKTECRLSLSLPEKKTQWMLLLKLSCMEGNSPAHNPRHYGMKVVEVCNI